MIGQPGKMIYIYSDNTLFQSIVLMKMYEMYQTQLCTRFKDNQGGKI